MLEQSPNVLVLAALNQAASLPQPLPRTWAVADWAFSWAHSRGDLPCALYFGVQLADFERRPDLSAAAFRRSGGWPLVLEASAWLGFAETTRPVPIRGLIYCRSVGCPWPARLTPRALGQKMGRRAQEALELSSLGYGRFISCTPEITRRLPLAGPDFDHLICKPEMNRRLR